MTGIHIELCINSGGNYKQTVETGAKLVAHLIKKHNLKINKVKQHADFYNKNCPAQIRAGKDGITWTKFIDMVKGVGESNKPSTGSTGKPQSKPNTSNKTVKPNYNTKSIVEFLQSISEPYSLNHRKKLAEYYGVKSYSGQAVKNIQLLDLIKKDYKANGKLRTSKPKAIASNKTTNKPTVKYPLPSGILRRGCKGNAVRQLQIALNAANFKVGNVDGIYGAKTEDAVRRFQMVHDAYNVDGVYGSRTRTRLDKVVNK
ncbi:MAG TPA: hypothetical protein GXZ58_08285 [Bacilli bacterium]|nr:hypothetical protein [Bacilli bacterium]